MIELDGKTSVYAISLKKAIENILFVKSLEYGCGITWDRGKNGFLRIFNTIEHFLLNPKIHFGFKQRIATSYLALFKINGNSLDKYATTVNYYLKSN